MADQFFISTGGIAHPYETVNVVSAYSFVAAPAFKQPDFTLAFRQAVDDMAKQAQKIGANGVIWIGFSPVSSGNLGYGVYAWGTAVRVATT